jgi:uncharacterized protein (DUF885 family)
VSLSLAFFALTAPTALAADAPAQLRSLLMGKLKVREGRRKPEGTLGERFDVRGFHDAVLANGMVPLPVLEAQVDAWISASGRQP